MSRIVRSSEFSSVRSVPVNFSATRNMVSNMTVHISPYGITAHELWEHRDTGYTITLHGDVPTEGFVVGSGEESLENPYDSEAIARYMESHADRYSVFGIWRDEYTGIVYVDAVQVVLSREKALKWAHKRHELAIWDIEANQEVRTY